MNLKRIKVHREKGNKSPTQYAEARCYPKKKMDGF